MSSHLDAAALRAASAQYASHIAIALLGEPNPALCSGRELRFGNRGSLAVAIAGPKAGLWFDHENGEGGDLFDLVRRNRTASFCDAIAFIREMVDLSPARSQTARRSRRARVTREGERAVDWALRMWKQAGPINDTPAAMYLQSRGVLEPALEAGESVLRFHPNCPFGNCSWHPCMLALMRDITSNEPRAVQRTALTQALVQAVSRNAFAEFKEAGGRVVRMTLGPMTGTAIKLSHDEDVTEGLTIGEGTESVLAAMLLGFRPAWALGGTSGVKAFPVLSGIDALTILVDNDASGAGQNAAEQCSKHWIEAGHEVFRAVPNRCGDDFNDVLKWSRA
jgi:putative DNA primase/helicase